MMRFACAGVLALQLTTPAAFAAIDEARTGAAAPSNAAPPRPAPKARTQPAAPPIEHADTALPALEPVVQISTPFELTAQPAPAKLMLSNAVVSREVRDALAAANEPVDARKHDVDTLRADRYEAFAQAFDEARVPDCLHGDALKRAPAAIGPIGLSGWYAVPFVLLAKLRGKCN